MVCFYLGPAVLIILVIILKGVSPWLISLLSLSGYNLPPVYNLIWQDLEGWEVVTPYFPGSDGPECDVKTNEARRSRHFTRYFTRASFPKHDLRPTPGPHLMLFLGLGKIRIS